MSLVDMFNIIKSILEISWATISGMVIGVVVFIVNVNILFLISTIVVLSCAWMSIVYFDKRISEYRKKHGLDEYGQNGTLLALMGVFVVVGVIFIAGYLIQDLSNAFKIF